MTTTTYRRPTGTLYIDGRAETATKAALFGAFASGAKIGLWHYRSGGYILGHIQGLRLESGFTSPDTARHLLVALVVSQADTWLHNLESNLIEVYVRADD